ncbi:hypothetical protein EDC01DRAFT_777524 [Geopyxis carbonaria]|nr:hypothetical protein EDC01DRAFT_777524 [Geopyxis carbonaria]
MPRHIPKPPLTALTLPLPSRVRLLSAFYSSAGRMTKAFRDPAAESGAREAEPGGIGSGEKGGTIGPRGGEPEAGDTTGTRPATLEEALGKPMDKKGGEDKGKGKEPETGGDGALRGGAGM